jgi:DNA-binding MarR family transcriptional regulator
MSTPIWSEMGLSGPEAAALGEDAATRIRTFRLILLAAQSLRTLMDQRLREDGLTTQQAALIGIAEAMGGPPLSSAARAMGTTHQNVKQIAAALQRKGLVRFAAAPGDARVRRVIPTKRNRGLWQRRSAADQREVLRWFSSLTPAESRTLFRMLVRLQENVYAALAASGHGSKRRRVLDRK